MEFADGKLMRWTAGTMTASSASSSHPRGATALCSAGRSDQFYSVAVIRYLQAARMPFLMPVVGHGRKPDHPLGPSGSQVFKAMKRSGWFEYTLSDPRKRTATVQICVKCRNRHARTGKKGREPWIYAYWGIGPKRFDWVKDTYRSRFGVEASYRQMNQCRIRTTTPRFAVRFLYVAIGF